MLIFLALIEEDADKVKFEQLYQTYNKVLFAEAMRILRNTQAAEDAVQEAMFRIAKNIKKISKVATSETMSFVIIIVRNVSLRIYAKEKRLKETCDMLVHNCPPWIEDNVLEELVTEDIVKEILCMPYIYRDILELSIVHGYTGKEISRLLGIRYETVKKRLQRGRQYLQKRMLDNEV